MIRLYDFELSGSCYKIRLLMNILGLQYEKTNVDFVNKEHKGEAFMRINPLGEIPVLEDEGLRLRDAQAIMVYLAKKYDRSGRWYPDDAAAMGQIQQWLSTGGGEVMNAAAARLVKILNYQLDLDKLHAGAHRIFKIMDTHLEGRQWLALDHPTIGDLACFPYTAMAGEGGISLEAYPNVRAWLARMRTIPGFIPMPGIPATVEQ